jgi:aspartyl-tRNA(Asn)/glutamyl-tRNA(Gln) amidotransferase subunit A
MPHPARIASLTRRDWLLAAGLALGAPAASRARNRTQPPDDLTTLSLADLRTKLRRGEVSPAAAVEAYLTRIGVVDTDVHAFVTLTADAARREAARLASARPEQRASLFGVPVAHKDLFETAGVPTRGGSKLFEQHRPARDATLVARLSGAGAVTLGKTNTHELGGGVTTINPFSGTTRNPVDRMRIAGGSSGGSAAAVAARLAAAATGSDTGGSIRIPAALCGCVGFKPTFGLLSTAGVLGASPTFDHTGFLTRTVPDLVPLLLATIGLDDRDASTVPAIPVEAPAPGSLRGLRIGTPRSFFFDGLDREIGRAMEAALSRASGAGAVVRDIALPVDKSTMSRVFDPIAVAEIHQTYERDWRERPGQFSDAFAEFFKAPLPSALELAAAYRERQRFQVDMSRVFEDVDVLAMPTVPVVAPPIAGPIYGELILRNTWPFNASRQPALTLPCGPADRLPVGLQLVGRTFDDARLLRIGVLIEAALR